MSIGRHAGVSDVGRKRRHNEDSFVVKPPLFAVADGMGGANAGEVASGLAVEAFSEGTALPAGEQHIVQLIQEANRRVFKRSSEDAEASGMGTTAVVALVEDSKVWFGHVGDSRAYLIRNGRMEQLTEDHSLVAELVRTGKIAPQDAERHPQRSVITRALGTDPDVDVDTFTVEAAPGDVFLLCSDGLHSMVSDKKILDIVQRNRGDLERAAKLLIDAANKNGGDDNVTVICFEIAPEGAETVRLPVAAAPEEAAPEPEEEETLDERDEVVAPRVSTMVLSADELAQLRGQAAPAAPAAAEPTTVAEEEPDFEPEEAARRRGPAVFVALALALAIMCGVVLLILAKTGVI